MSATALVVGVGASHGLGAASARSFARAGFRTVIAGRTRQKLGAGRRGDCIKWRLHGIRCR